jgi:GAF domain-containing protein
MPSYNPVNLSVASKRYWMASTKYTENSVISYPEGIHVADDEPETPQPEFEELPLPHIILDSDARFLSANPAWERLTGHSPQDTHGRFLGDFLAKDSLKDFEAHLPAFMESGVLHGLELSIIGRDSKPNPVLFDACIRKDADGRFLKAQCMLTPLTSQKITEADLRHRLMIEELARRISHNFINVREDAVDELIEKSLEALGKFTGADRCHLTILSDDASIVVSHHEWCGGDISCLRDKILEVSSAPFRWIREKIGGQELIHIPRLEDLPPAASEEKKVWESHGTKSILALPLLKGERLLGYLGFSSNDPSKKWEADDVRVLEIINDVFTEAILWKREKKNIQARDERLKALLEFSKTLSGSEGPALMAQALEKLGQAFKASRAYVYENSSDERGRLLMSLLWEWCDDGVHPLLYDPSQQKLPYDSDNAINFSRVLDLGTAYYGVTHDFPEDEQKILSLRGVKSIAAVPIHVDGLWWGYLGLEDHVLHRTWEPSTIQLLLEAGIILGNAIGSDMARQDTEKLKEHYRMLSELTSDFAYCLRVEGDNTLALEWASEGFQRVSGVSPADFAKSGGWGQYADFPDQSLLKDHMSSLLSAQEDTCEFRIQGDAGLLWLRDHAIGVWDEKLSRVARICGAVQDVTEYKKAGFDTKSLED